MFDFQCLFQFFDNNVMKIVIVAFNTCDHHSSMQRTKIFNFNVKIQLFNLPLSKWMKTIIVISLVTIIICILLLKETTVLFKLLQNMNHYNNISLNAIVYSFSGLCITFQETNALKLP